MLIMPTDPRSAAEREAAVILPEGVRDGPTVDGDGRPITRLDGVVFARTVVHGDHRGSLMEMINLASPFWDEPIVHAYLVTIAPGRIKGWGMHRHQADRYATVSGRLRVVLYDGRVDSPTFGAFAEFHFLDEAPGLLRIPPGVWHADQNVGDTPCRLINFPTRSFDRDAPDKYRIDPSSNEIPFDFTLRDG
jgi:dTDP-4-dehydrorhamnose 3,5-epimerase